MSVSDPRHDHPSLRGVELDVLLSVLEKPRHGYAILQAAEERAGGHPGFEIPTLYRALRRMQRDGLIEPVEPPAQDVDERRVYWRATRAGRLVADAEIRRLEQLVEAGRAAGLGVARGDR